MADEKIWWPRDVGAYHRKTASLSMAEHGAYVMLLDEYYSTGKPLPNDMKKIFRICRATSRKERQICVEIVQKYFTSNGHDLHNKRADEELLKRSEISEKRRSAANVKHANAGANAPANAPTSTNTSTRTESINPNTVLTSTARPSGFGSSNLKLEGKKSPRPLSPAAIEAGKKHATGWDIYYLEEQYRQFLTGKPKPDNEVGAFIGWIKKFTKGKPPP